MAKYRLKQDDRENIAQRAAQVTLVDNHKRQEAQAERLDQLARDIYDNKYTTKVRAAMIDLPNGWLPTVSGFRVQFGGRHVELNLLTGRFLVKASDAKSWGHTFASYEASHKFSRRFLDVESKHIVEYDKRNAEYHEIRAVLGTFKTLEALVDGWPEMTPYIKGIGQTVISAVAVTDFVDLNERLGLPRAEKEVS